MLIQFAHKLYKQGFKRQARQLLASMKKDVQDFDHVLDNKVVSNELLKSHFKLYQGYVDALNRICNLLDKTSSEDNSYTYGEYSELKRRMSVAYNGAVLHEYYFEHLEPLKVSSKPSGDLLDLIKQRWGSVDKYMEDIKATALAAGNGWVVTLYHPSHGLENALVTEHHIGHFAGFTPIMVLDTWEHAFAFDYKTDRGEYVQKFLDNLNFELIQSRLAKSL